MATNKLILRSTASPYNFPTPDLTRGRVLGWGEVDNNFIFLKGLNIKNGVYDSGANTITLNRINGGTISITGVTGGGGGSGSTLNTYVSGGTYGGDTIVFRNTTGGTFSVTGITGGSGGTGMYASTDNYTSGVTKTITHSLGSTDVMVQLIDNNELINGEVNNYQLNSVDITLSQNLVGVKTLVAGGLGGGGGGGSTLNTYTSGGTYASDAGEITFTNTTGGTYVVSGITGGGGGSGNTAYSSIDNYVSAVTKTITHNLGTTSIVAQLVDTGSNEQIVGYLNNYQLNSVDVLLSDTLPNVKISIVSVGGSGTTGGSDVFVTGGTFTDTTTVQFTNNSGGTFDVTGFGGGGSGSTSPAGSNTWVQFNDSGSFGAESGLTYNSSGQLFTATSNLSGKTMIGNIGQPTFAGFPFAGSALKYNNPLSGGTSFLTVGDLTNISGQDNHTVMGYLDMFGGVTAFISMAPGDGVNLTSEAGGLESKLTMGHDKDTEIKIPALTASTSKFKVVNGSRTLLQTDFSGITTFNEAYSFPTIDGSANQVLETDGGGNLSWTSVSGGGGSSIVIEGAGSGSTMRCGFSNQAAGIGSTTFGNANTTSGQYGTIGGGRDNQALSANTTIGGGASNIISGQFSTVGGGYGHTITSDYSTIGGGRCSNASGNSSTVGGGQNNTASNSMTTVAGGVSNTASGYASVVGGGRNNEASQSCATISGGYCNKAFGACSTIGGGYFNYADGNTSTVGGGQNNCSINSTVGGGYYNNALGANSTVSGGWCNNSTGNTATIVGGTCNKAFGNCSFVGGGKCNTASGNYSTMVGGSQNTVSAYRAFIGGGYNNINSGNTSTIGGGVNNNINSIGSLSFLGGGSGNCISHARSAIVAGVNNTASGYASYIGAGCSNIASGTLSTIGGGDSNTASAYGTTVGGGQSNFATGTSATIAGGINNCAIGTYSSVLGGNGNTASGYASSVLGGINLSAGTNTSAVPNLDINGEVRLIGTSSYYGGAIPTSATTYARVTLDGTDYCMPLFVVI